MRKSIMFSLACCLAAASWAGCSDETSGDGDDDGAGGEAGSGGGTGNTGNTGTSTSTGTSTGTGTGSGTGTGTGSSTGTGTGTEFECGVAAECSAGDPVACVCEGCNAECTGPEGEALSDCTCAICAADPFCSDATNCVADGVCDALNEGCVCADCAGHPSC